MAPAVGNGVNFGRMILFSSPLMVSFLAIMENELGSGAVKRGLSNQNEPFQAGLFNSPHKSFREGIQIWGTDRQANGFDARSPEGHPEVLAEHTGPIMNEIAAAAHEPV